MLSRSSEKDINAISISALISAGPEDTGCPSLSLRLQPLLGIWGHCLPLCCPTGSTVHCSLPAFTGFPVSGYHVLCLFSLLFVCIHPIGFFRTSTKPFKKRRWHYLNYWEDKCIFISSEISVFRHEGLCLVLRRHVFW